MVVLVSALVVSSSALELLSSAQCAIVVLSSAYFTLEILSSACSVLVLISPDNSTLFPPLPAPLVCFLSTTLLIEW
ncbi:hypothetical protein QQF64_022290 [Cirrhinus molitorella]|uniref:Secreted protein n=1 Tax=Cirrhinus molitorella TaxID=172907 RepID=A0ABR3L7W5_9TELE